LCALLAPACLRSPDLRRPLVLQGHDHDDDEQDQHQEASQRERLNFARHGADLPAPRPDAQPGLIGAGEMPHQQPGDDRDDNSQGETDLAGRLGSFKLTA
jgi:hypothetical protein